MSDIQEWLLGVLQDEDVNSYMELEDEMEAVAKMREKLLSKLEEDKDGKKEQK